MFLKQNNYYSITQKTGLCLENYINRIEDVLQVEQYYD